MRKKKGFTLIELLVVIAIIGLLSTLAVVSLNSARAKARDAKRLSDVKQMSTVIEMERASLGDDADIVCESTAGTLSALTENCSGPNEISQFSSFLDPTGSTACASGSSAPCAYAIYPELLFGLGTSAAPTRKLGDYKICFALESASGSLSEGLNAIKTGGVMGTCD